MLSPLSDRLGWLRKAEAGVWSVRELVAQVRLVEMPERAPRDLPEQVQAQLDLGRDAGEVFDPRTGQPLT